MKVLVINTGSSSLKYQLINMKNEQVMAKGLCDRIGIDNSFIKHSRYNGDTIIIDKDLHNHKVAIQEVIKIMIDGDNGVIKSMNEIIAVGHRVVHGGENFHESVIIDKDVMNAIKSCTQLAPLHNPPNIVGIEACQQTMPNTPMIAVFDTAFHQTMARHAFLYAIPYEMYEKYGIRKYGFHGTSHKYVAGRAAKMLGRPIEDLRLIICHLGNGSSVCAVKNGKSVETSMGFTPLAGLVMGTRCGDIDPAIVTFIIEKEKLTAREMDDVMNKKSGVLGISGVGSDFRDLETAADEGNDRAGLALEIFAYKVKKYIGEYAAVLDGADAIVFTAGIGENNGLIREMILRDMSRFGVELDKEKNTVKGKETIISGENSKIKVLVVPTNEELAIARETIQLIKPAMF